MFIIIIKLNLIERKEMIRKFNIIVYNFARNIRRISRTSNTEVENIGDR